MPTAGKLAGAVAFFIYGWYLATLATPLFPESNPPDFFGPLCLGIGILCGWIIVGRRAGRGYNAAFGNGLTGAAAFVFWVIFLLSFHTMIQQALRRLYDGPMEALTDVFALMLEQGQDLADVNLIVNATVGGIVGAWITEYFAKRYP